MSADCDNGNACDGLESCIDGSCVPGEPIDCDDGIACTIDACEEDSGRCTHEPNHFRCGAFEACEVGFGCQNDCVITTCVGKVYECGDCVDNDGDGAIDMQDPDCWGPCDNRETGWLPEVPASHPLPSCLKMDCYFDQDGGSGNDDCYWSHTCDPLEPATCTYDPNASVPGSSRSCAELSVEQSAQCQSYCGPLTPNGCDCFGCCEVHLENETVTVYLGTTQHDGHGSCNLSSAHDSTLCNPCTPVEACLNPCDECELCLGKSTISARCSAQDQCPGGEQPCGLPGQTACEPGFFCNTGCCQPNPR